jgi:hypothetical protein
MKIPKHWPLYLLLVAFLVLGTRLAWSLTVSETGWKPHLEQWTNILCDLLGIEHTDLGDQDPRQQARFWLDEVPKVKSVADEPQKALGAAWILDSPQYGFIRRHLPRRVYGESMSAFFDKWARSVLALRKSAVSNGSL